MRIAADESASASEEMNAQAEKMKGMVNDLVTLISGDIEAQCRRPKNHTLPENAQTEPSVDKTKESFINTYPDSAKK